MAVKKSKTKKSIKPTSKKSVAKNKAAKPRVKSPKLNKMISKAKVTGSIKQSVDSPLGVGNAGLTMAKNAKNDEFYTQWVDIEREVNAYLECDPNIFRDKIVLLPCDDPEWSNFTKFFALHFKDFGLKKLISTSFAPNSKPAEIPYQLTLFEQDAPQFDETKTRIKGKKFVLEAKDVNADGVINIEDLQWEYLEGDGDFRSDEITALRDEADIVVTNPPFSLFREFLSWLIKGRVKFSVIGNMNAITYKDVFPHIRENHVWVGATNFNLGMYFRVPESFVYAPTYKFERDRGGVKVNRVPGVCWYTNLDHGRRHEPLQLMTAAENKKHSKFKEVRGIGYQKYDNYDAIEVPYFYAIPSDCSGVMGVPISFLAKYNPDQFEIVGMCENEDLYNLKTRVYARDECKAAYKEKFGRVGSYDLNASGVIVVNGVREKVYQRLLIKHKAMAK